MTVCPWLLGSLILQESSSTSSGGSSIFLCCIMTGAEPEQPWQVWTQNTNLLLRGRQKKSYLLSLQGSLEPGSSAWRVIKEGMEELEMEMIASQVSAAGGRGGGDREVEAHTCCQEGIRWKSRSGKESTCVPPPCLQPFQSSSVHRQALSLWQSRWDTNHVEAQPNSRDRKAAFCHALFYSLASGYVLSPMNSLLFFHVSSQNTNSEAFLHIEPRDLGLFFQLWPELQCL